MSETISVRVDEHGNAVLPLGARLKGRLVVLRFDVQVQPEGDRSGRPTWIGSCPDWDFVEPEDLPLEKREPLE